MTGHIGTNTPKFVPPCWGRPLCDPTQTGLCKFGCGFGAQIWLSWRLESFSLRPERVSKRFSFGGGSLRSVLNLSSLDARAAVREKLKGNN